MLHLLGQCEYEKLSLDEIVVGFQGNFSFGKARIKCKKEGDGIIVDAVCDGKTGALITYQSIFTQSTPHSAHKAASSFQWSFEPGLRPTQVSVPAHVYKPNTTPLECA